MQKVSIKRILLFILALLPIYSVGQENQTDHSLFPQSQFQLFLSPVACNSLDLKNHGPEILQSRTTFSGILGIGISQKVFNTWGVNAGAELGVVPYNLFIPYELEFDTVTYKASFGKPFREINVVEYIHFTYNFTASVEKIFYYKPKTFISLEAGLKMNRLVAYPYEQSLGINIQTQDSSNVRLFIFHLNNNHRQLFPGCFLKMGILKLNRKLNSGEIKLVAHYSPHKIGKGWYRFYKLEEESFGTAELGLNYIGLEFRYGITVAQKSIQVK